MEDTVRVYRSSLTLDVMFEATDTAEAGNLMTRMSLEVIGREVDRGEMVGLVRKLPIRQLAEDEIVPALRSLGNDGTFFDPEGDPDAAAAEDATEGRILRAMIDQGWSSSTLSLFHRRFLEEAGLMNAFADFLEREARREHETTPTDEGIEP